MFLISYVVTGWVGDCTQHSGRSRKIWDLIGSNKAAAQVVGRAVAAEKVVVHAHCHP